MAHSGLTHQEASRLLRELGPNELRERHKISPAEILMRQVRHNFVVYLLIASAVMAFFLGERETTFVISAVIGLVILTGFIQEYKAENAMKALKEMVTPVARVFRDGAEREIPARDIVPGDLIILRSGERVPADCRILEENRLRVNEAVLTGESKEVDKKVSHDPKDTDESHFLFMGSFIVNGGCTAVVTHTGMNTKFGNIAGMISETEKNLPLQDKINNISKYMAATGMTAAVLTGFVILLRQPVITIQSITDVVILIIAIAVSSFPEGLPLVLTTTLAVGMARMAKQNAIVNRMSVIETLGETTVICTDKTGTITKGEMTVRTIYANGVLYEVSGTGYAKDGSIMSQNRELTKKDRESLGLLISASVLCNDASLEDDESGKAFKILGSATEGALLVMAAKHNVFRENFVGNRLEEIPFDSERKMMSAMYQDRTDRIVYVKGAPEKILGLCKNLNNRVEIEDTIKKFTKSSLRLIALAYKKESGKTSGYTEKDLTFLGLVAMEDPPREDVRDAITLCRNAGISVKMITGDNKDTARAIATQVGLTGSLFEGEQLSSYSDEELVRIVKDTSVFARVTPADKLRIVKALKTDGAVVTMTGDGVNDAPALKEAHIGIAMGVGGTDVSRSVADITLKDNNFATIVTAIREGRTIYNNIRLFTSYQLSCSVAEIIILFLGVVFAPVFGWFTPIITALQVIFMNLVTDSLPAIMLGFTPAAPYIMHEKPRKNPRLISPDLFRIVLGSGIIIGLLAVAVLYFSFNIMKLSIDEARTTTLVGMILLDVGAAFTFRSFRQGVLNRKLFMNSHLFIAGVISLLLTVVVVYIRELGLLFETAPIGHNSWVLALLAGLWSLIIFDILKIINNRTHVFLRQT